MSFEEENHESRLTNTEGLFNALTQVSVGSQSVSDETPEQKQSDDQLMENLFEEFNSLSQRGKRTVKELAYRLRKRKEQQTHSARKRKKVLPQRVISKVHSRITNQATSKITSYVKSYCNYNIIHQFKPEHVVYILLYYMCFNPSLRELSAETALPSSKLSAVLSKLEPTLLSFVSQYLKVNQLQERKDAANRRIPSSYDDDIRDITALIDGVHFKTVAPNVTPYFYDANVPFYSFKESSAGLVVQVITDVEWVFSLENTIFSCWFT
jgi:hypothetical protein